MDVEVGGGLWVEFELRRGVYLVSCWYGIEYKVMSGWVLVFLFARICRFVQRGGSWVSG